MKFAFLGYGLEKNWGAMSKSELDAMFEVCFAYDNKLLREGHLIGDGTALQPSRTAKTLRWQNGAVVVTDGPYAETKEQLGGIGVLEAVDIMHAVELISKHPGLHYGATFEIRPINEEALKCHAKSVAEMRVSAPAADSQGSRFAGLGFIDEHRGASISDVERDAMMQSCIAFDLERVKNGQWLSGISLQSARTAKTLRAKAGQTAVTDGPFAETKECLGGIVVGAYQDLNHAVSTLSKHPALAFGVVIEIRPLDEETSRRWQVKVGASQDN
jgi:hypothetical protein